MGKLIYLSHTRPDIAFAVSVVSQFMHSPRQAHLDAVFRIVKYLKSTPGKGLFFAKHGHTQIEAYTDADWAGYCSFIEGYLVTWRSAKQETARSG